MADVTELKMARLGDLFESKADAPKPGPKGKGGKVKPKPPWMQDDDPEDQVDGGADEAEEDDPEDVADGGADEDTEDESDDMPPKKKPGKGGKKALPSPQKPPSGFSAKKPVPAQNTAKARRKGTAAGPVVRQGRSQHNSRGTAVSMATRPAPKGIAAKSAAKPTVWGPPSQHVDIRRAGVSHVGSDARVSAASRQRSNGPVAKPGTGSAGGNGVTGGRGDGRAAARTPENVRKRRSTSSVRHSGEMGEGAAWGRSGSAVVPHKPANIKALADFTPDQIEAALEITAKALRGYVADYRSGEARDFE